MSSRADGGAIAILVGLGLVLLMIIFAVVIWWKIFSKAGYSGALGLLMFIPIVNLIMLIILAFGEWPIQRELDMLRQQVRQPQAYYPPQAAYQPQGYYQPPQGNQPLQ